MDDVNRVPVAADPTQVSSTASSAWPLGAQASPAPEHGLFRAALAAPAASALAACSGGGSPPPPPPTLPPPAPPPPARSDAARLLTQATYGAGLASIADVQRLGLTGWIDDQFTRPQVMHRSYVEQEIAAGLAANPALNETNLINRVMDTFWKQAITGEDQLRQRVVFALSQIFVVSQVNADIRARPRGLSSYLDMLGTHAFGNFRTLLEAVSLHPMMGLYLSSLRNQKEDPTTGRVPDENYAREVMQLFTIGLYKLNPDGTQVLSGGKPIPTYTNEDVEGLAKVFTGFSWAGADTSNSRFFGSSNVIDPDRDVKPMQAYPQHHSTSEKRFLGTVVTASTSATGSLKSALDALFNHENVGPFIGRQLIQRLVTSNPSSAYISRVTAAFNNNGQGVRGDMKALIRAILTDTEARSTTTAAEPAFGKLREPVVRLANWARACEATSTSGKFTIRAVGDATTQLGQNPLSSGSVFNFFRPGYTPPGTAFATQGLVAPEFQILGENAAAGYLNFMRTVITNGVGDGADVKSSYASLIALANTPDALVNQVKLLFTCDAMSTATWTAIRDAIASVAIPTTGADTALLNRARLAVFLTMASPEFTVQK
jgi:uncharacterized protein (DUF1800 family)